MCRLFTTPTHASAHHPPTPSHICTQKLKGVCLPCFAPHLKAQGCHCRRGESATGNTAIGTCASICAAVSPNSWNFFLDAHPFHITYVMWPLPFAIVRVIIIQGMHVIVSHDYRRWHDHVDNNRNTHHKLLQLHIGCGFGLRGQCNVAWACWTDRGEGTDTTECEWKRHQCLHGSDNVRHK